MTAYSGFVNSCSSLMLENQFTVSFGYETVVCIYLSLMVTHHLTHFFFCLGNLPCSHSESCRDVEMPPTAETENAQSLLSQPYTAIQDSWGTLWPQCYRKIRNCGNNGDSQCLVTQCCVWWKSQWCLPQTNDVACFVCCSWLQIFKRAAVLQRTPYMAGLEPGSSIILVSLRHMLPFE